MITIFGAVAIAYLLVVEGLDWQGRLDIVESKWPTVHKLIISKPTRLLLMVVTCVLIVHDIESHAAIPEAPTVVFPAPRAPAELVAGMRTVVRVTAADEPLRVSTVLLGMGKAEVSGRPGNGFIVTGLTNKPISPVDVTLTCEAEILALENGPSLGGKFVYENMGHQQIDSKTVHYWIGSPAWAFENPLALPIFSQANDPKCQMKRNK